MDYTIIYALLFVMIPFASFLLFSTLIIYHLKKYGLEGNYNRASIFIYSLGIIAIAITLAERFLFINWSEVNVDDFIDRSNFNFSSSEYYER